MKVYDIGVIDLLRGESQVEEIKIGGNRNVHCRDGRRRRPLFKEEELSSAPQGTTSLSCWWQIKKNSDTCHTEKVAARCDCERRGKKKRLDGSWEGRSR